MLLGRDLFIPGTYVRCFAFWVENLHRGVWRLKASKPSHHSHVYNVLQRTAGFRCSVLAPLYCDSEKHPGTSREKMGMRNGEIK